MSLIKQGTEIQRLAEQKNDTGVIHSVDTIVTQTASVFNAEQQCVYDTLAAELERLAAPILRKLQKGEVRTQIEANNIVSQFVITSSNLIREQAKTEDEEFNKQLTDKGLELMVNYQTIFYNYTQKLPLGID